MGINTGVVRRRTHHENPFSFDWPDCHCVFRAC